MDKKLANEITYQLAHVQTQPAQSWHSRRYDELTFGTPHVHFVQGILHGYCKGRQLELWAGRRVADPIGQALFAAGAARRSRGTTLARNPAALRSFAGTYTKAKVRASADTADTADTADSADMHGGPSRLGYFGRCGSAADEQQDGCTEHQARARRGGVAGVVGSFVLGLGRPAPLARERR